MSAYQRITDSLRRRLLSGQWPPARQLPTERELCQQFAASRITIRRALQILEQEQLVERRQGRGTFARTRTRQKIPILKAGFFESVRRHSPPLKRRLHSWQWTNIDRELAAPLHACPGDPVLTALRIDELHGEPVAFDEVVLAGRYADRLTECDLAQLDFYVRWQRVQDFRVDHSTQTIEATKAKSPASRLLNIRAGEPLLKETEVMYVTDGQPAGLFVTYYRHDCFRFDVTFDYSEGTTHE